MIQIKPIYIDNHLIVVEKPGGILVQQDITGDISLLDIVKLYLKDTFQKPGNVYLGLVHRLDRPASGVMVFARTSKAASRLSDQFRTKKIKKTYWVLLQGKTPEQGVLKDNIEKRGASSFITGNSRGKPAELSFKRLKYFKDISLVEVDLKTGRHHQIRVQFAHRGYSVLGDFRYGSKMKFPQKTIALHAQSIIFTHPTLQELKTFKVDPPSSWENYMKL